MSKPSGEGEPREPCTHEMTRCFALENGRDEIEWCEACGAMRERLDSWGPHPSEGAWAEPMGGRRNRE
jgi:hypothetical protein